MKIVVLGASGFIGRRLCAELAKKGHVGVAVSRFPLESLPPCWQWRDRNTALNAVASHDEVFTSPDVVLHLEVKQHVVTPTRADVDEFDRVNVKGTQEWLRWCTERSVRRFIYFSSVKAVGDADACQHETTESVPTTPYGISKRKAEEIVTKWAAADSARMALILRPAVVYGPGNTGNVFSMAQAIDRGYFFLAGRNENVKSVVSLTNVCAAVAFLIGQMQKGTQIYHLVDRENYRICDLASLVARQLGHSSPPASLPLSFMRTVAVAGDFVGRWTGKNLPINTSRLRAMVESTQFSAAKLVRCGFIHPQTTEDGMKEMITWYRGTKRTSDGC